MPGTSVRSVARAALPVLVGCIGVVTALAIAGAGRWPLILAEQFELHYLVAACTLAVLAASLRRVEAADGAALVALVNLGLVATVAPDARRPDAHDARVRVLALNVLTENRDHAAVARLIAATGPDVIVLVEVDATWLAALADATAEYPGRIEHPRRDNFGVAVYARWPLVGATIHDLGGVPAAVVALGPEAAGLTVIAAHVLPPVDGAAAAAEATQLDALAELARARTGPLIVAGDLNATPWSRRFRRVVARSGLRDSRAGFGIQASFPAALGWAGIPIDHALVSAEIAVVDRRVGPDVGSDHRPILVDLAIRR
jgi:endonuclease/exonuclease/phosphatase (EEP) superfamily protein YafD